MDATDAIRCSDTVRAAIRSGDVGTIVRSLRRANNITLAELAARCGYSTSTLSRMERGKQPLSDIRVLRSLAEALGIPPHVLGLADTPRRSRQTLRPTARVKAILVPDEETDPMRRRTLLAGLTSLAGTVVLGSSSGQLTAAGHPTDTLDDVLLGPPSTGAPVALPRLRRDVTAARSVFQHGRYAEVGARLPSLLATATATRAELTTSEDIATVNGRFADIYTLGSELMVKLGHEHLAWTTADRAMHAARDSADILALATASRAWAVVLRRAGRTDTAHRVVVDTASALQPELRHGPDHLAVYATLLSTAAYTAAVNGDRTTARTLIDEAADAANQLSAHGNLSHRAFGPTGVRLYQVSIARVLGDLGTAIETARRINPATIPLGERRARYWTDIARTFHQWDKPERCYRALLAAEREAPDEVRYRKPIQDITTSLLQHPTAQALPGLRNLADRTGAST